MSPIVLVFALALASSPEAVGIATSAGGIRIDGLAVAGTGSIPDGARVETEARPARLTLRHGVTVDLGAHSRVRLHAGQLFLEAGAATVRGRMNVLSGQGVLVARTTADAPVALRAPPAPSSATEVSGVVMSQDGVFLLEDEASQLTLALEADGAEAEKLNQVVGKKATVRGQLRNGKLHVSAVEAVTAGAAAAGTAAAAATVAAQAGSATAGVTAAAATAGISKAVIAGVAIAGAAATGATVGFVQSQSEPASTVSQ